MKRLLFLMTLLLVTGPAQANYILLDAPDTIYNLVVEAGQWKVDGDHVVVRGKRVKVDPFLFCHYTNSNMSCAGQTQEFTREQLEKVGADPSKRVMVRVAKSKEGPVVVGLAHLDFADAYEKARGCGSWVLGLEVEQVKSLGPAGYRRRMIQMGRDHWRQFKALGLITSSHSRCQRFDAATKS